MSKVSFELLERLAQFKVTGAAALAVLTTALPVTKVLSYRFAGDALDASKAKLAIPVYLEDPDLKGEKIGYIYGAGTGVEANIAEKDRSIPIDPKELEEGGNLYYWYQAIIALEDNGHEGGVSDFTGINPRMPLTLVLRQGGGSSIADQACGAMRTEISKFSYYDSTSGFLVKNTGKVRKKLEETLCGIGLAQKLTPKEIAAEYATYAYLAKYAWGIEGFVIKYWGLDGTDDERLTIGKQLILAGLLKRPWGSSSGTWEKTMMRAEYALDKLIEKGIISTQDRGYVIKDIKESKPLDSKEIKNPHIKPKKGYEKAMVLAMVESAKRFGADWKSKVASMKLALDPNVQGTIYAESRSTLVEIDDPNARTIVAVVDSEGRIIGFHSSDLSNQDQFNYGRFVAERTPGSQGKILLAAGVGNKGFAAPVKDPYSNSFYRNLSLSNKAIIQAAKEYGVKSDEIKDLVKCYGRPHDSNDQVTKAAFGMFETSPYVYVATLYEANSGIPLPLPHIVTNYEMRDGSVVEVEKSYRENAQTCADLMYANGLTKTWLRAPLDSRGTLRDLVGFADIGKTGTVGEASGQNSMAWTIAGREFKDGSFYTVIAGFGSDNNEPIPTLSTGGNVAGPVVRETLITLNERKRKNALVKTY